MYKINKKSISKMFCHSHKDYLYRITSEYSKNKLSFFPIMIISYNKYHVNKMLSLIEKNRNEDFINDLKNDKSVLSLQKIDSWTFSEKYSRNDNPFKKYEFNLLSITASHDKQPSITKFSMIHNLFLKYQCVFDGKDFFSFIMKPNDNYLINIKKKMNNFGELDEHNKMVNNLMKLGDHSGCNDQFGKIIYYIMKISELDDESIQVYFKARQHELFSNYSPELLEKCANSLYMHPNCFRKKYWKISNIMAPLVGRVSSALIDY